MATISSNMLGLYAFATPSTSPLEVIVDTAFASIVDADLTAITIGDYFLAVTTAGAFLAIGKRAAAAGVPTDETASLELMALATSSNLEASNTINETAARNGSGSSTNYIASGAMSWSTSVDGLLDVAAAAGSAITLMDAARNKYYMIAKFDMDEGASNTFYAGQALIDTVSITGGVDDIASYSASLSGYGDLYKG